MGEGLQFIDLIFFAMVAVFLILRLRSVLGRRTGHEKESPGLMTMERRERDKKAERQKDDGDGEKPDNVIDLPVRPGPRPVGAAPTPQEAGLAAIAAADGTFEPAGFLEGAKAAFEMIVMAFAAGDEGALRPLLSDAVLNDFSQVIDARAAAGETVALRLMAAPSGDIVGAEMHGRIAFVTVRFVSEQETVVHNAAGDVVDGEPGGVARVVDVWTFSRDTRARDPNWTLVETRVGD